MADKVLPFEFVLSLSPAPCSDGNADFHGYCLNSSLDPPIVVCYNSKISVSHSHV